mmetsp:Transcript_2122/g.4889  ORF Transcript_2122/g.4889 Transcript_2122/m.4889 type:complete len:207 (+) Transcript_2122:683-1303(+)
MDVESKGGRFVGRKAGWVGLGAVGLGAVGLGAVGLGAVGLGAVGLLSQTSSLGFAMVPEVVSSSISSPFPKAGLISTSSDLNLSHSFLVRWQIPLQSQLLPRALAPLGSELSTPAFPPSSVYGSLPVLLSIYTAGPRPRAMLSAKSQRDMVNSLLYWSSCSTDMAPPTCATLPAKYDDTISTLAPVTKTAPPAALLSLLRKSQSST